MIQFYIILAILHFCCKLFFFFFFRFRKRHYSPTDRKCEEEHESDHLWWCIDRFLYFFKVCKIYPFTPRLEPVLPFGGYNVMIIFGFWCNKNPHFNIFCNNVFNVKLDKVDLGQGPCTVCNTFWHLSNILSLSLSRDWAEQSGMKLAEK